MVLLYVAQRASAVTRHEVATLLDDRMCGPDGPDVSWLGGLHPSAWRAVVAAWACFCCDSILVVLESHTHILLWHGAHVQLHTSFNDVVCVVVQLVAPDASWLSMRRALKEQHATFFHAPLFGYTYTPVIWVLCAGPIDPRICDVWCAWSLATPAPWQAGHVAL